MQGWEYNIVAQDLLCLLTVQPRLRRPHLKQKGSKNIARNQPLLEYKYKTLPSWIWQHQRLIVECNQPPCFRQPCRYNYIYIISNIIIYIEIRDTYKTDIYNGTYYIYCLYKHIHIYIYIYQIHRTKTNSFSLFSGLTSTSSQNPPVRCVRRRRAPTSPATDPPHRWSEWFVRTNGRSTWNIANYHTENHCFFEWLVVVRHWKTGKQHFSHWGRAATFAAQLRNVAKPPLTQQNLLRCQKANYQNLPLARMPFTICGSPLGTRHWSGAFNHLVSTFWTPGVNQLFQDTWSSKCRRGVLLL